MGKTIFFKNKPKIVCGYSVAGPKESNGKIGSNFDEKLTNDMLKEKSFEKAEIKILFNSISGLIDKSKLKEKDIDCIFAGDLLNQIIASSFAVRNFDISFCGLYNACATFCESLILGSICVDGDYMKNVVCATSSHFSSAERQYRYPLELGSTRPPQSQWTVTGAGAVLLTNNKEINGITVKSATIGKIVDFGVVDANNMGSAMAPSACDTIISHFKNTKTSPNDYDLILTGDLGALGSKILKDLVWEKGYDIKKQHYDCGELIFNNDHKEYQGGSGAGCSSLVFSSYILKKLVEKKYKRILFMTTGALLSTITTQQGESIPGITHAVDIGG